MSVNSWRALFSCKVDNCCSLSADFCVQSIFICCHLLDGEKERNLKHTEPNNSHLVDLLEYISLSYTESNSHTGEQHHVGEKKKCISFHFPPFTLMCNNNIFSIMDLSC